MPGVCRAGPGWSGELGGRDRLQAAGGDLSLPELVSAQHTAWVPTFIARKKARVPKMVKPGWCHSNHRFWGSGCAGQGGDEFRVITAQELLSNSESKSPLMESWSRRRGSSAVPSHLANT